MPLTHSYHVAITPSMLRDMATALEEQIAAGEETACLVMHEPNDERVEIILTYDPALGEPGDDPEALLKQQLRKLLDTLTEQSKTKQAEESELTSTDSDEGETQESV